MDDPGWLDIRLGLSGATVRRSADGRRYRKSVIGVRARGDLIAERDRLLWLAEIGFPAARVIDWTEAGVPDHESSVSSDSARTGSARTGSARTGSARTGSAPNRSAPTAVLTTSAVPGVPISSVSRSDARTAARSLALLLRDLHAVPTASCPFDRTLSVTLTEAQAAVVAGTVDADDFDEERAGLPPSEALGQLLTAAPGAAAAEPADLVVCHGDACLPNVLVDPTTLQPTGIVDVGRLGVADRHQDLALATRSLADPDLNPAFGSGCAELFVDTYVAAIGLDPSRMDAGRLAFYRLLDEFF